MPARRRHRTPKPPEPVQPDPMVEIDRVWVLHQEDERQRRAPVPLDEQIRRAEQEVLRQQRKARQRERTRQRILQAIHVVEADFARWRADA